MLILSRKVNETITINGTIQVRILEITEGHVKLGIDAPKEIPVYRSEIYHEIGKVNTESARVEKNKAVRAAGRLGRISAPDKNNSGGEKAK